MGVRTLPFENIEEKVLRKSPRTNVVERFEKVCSGLVTLLAVEVHAQVMKGRRQSFSVIVSDTIQIRDGFVLHEESENTIYAIVLQFEDSKVTCDMAQRESKPTFKRLLAELWEVGFEIN